MSKTQEKPPRLTGEIIGFRQWEVNADLRLASGGMRYAWEKDVNEAKCLKDPAWGQGKPCKHSPNEGCDCGLYALHAPTFWYGADKASNGLTFSWAFGGEKVYVAGLLSAWGRVQVHHDGFRAQYAKPVAIAIPDDRKRDAALANAIAAEYGLPTVPQAELERIASEFGTLVPEEHRPEKPKPATLEFKGLANIINAQISGNSFWTSSSASKSQPHIYQPRYHHYWQASVDVDWDNSSLEKPEPGKTIEELARRNKPKYDPQQFLPKRKGGRR